LVKPPLSHGYLNAKVQILELTLS